MAWTRHGADQKAIDSVDIVVYHGTSAVSFPKGNIQFPPKITNDSKSATFESKPVLTYEPLKIFKGSEARSLGLEFKWVTGGNFVPSKIKDSINIWKNCLYYGDANEPLTRAPIVKINKLYKVIEGGATFRLMNIKVGYSEELIQIGGDWWHVETTLSVDLELAHTLAGYGTGTKEFFNDTRLNKTPQATWL